MPCTTKECIWIHFGLLVFIPVQNLARLFRILPVFEFFVAIAEPPPCLLLLVTTHRPLEALRLPAVCAKPSASSENPSLLQNKIRATPRQFISTYLFFFGSLGLLPQYFLYCFSYRTVLF
jgi:hypothetical protein